MTGFVLAAMVLAAPAFGQYRFEAVQSYPASLTVFMQQPPINGRGDVVFMKPEANQFQVGGLFVARKNGRPATVLPHGFAEARAHAMNAQGEVVFIDSADGNVYRGSGASRLLVAEREEGEGEEDRFEFFGPCINNAGVVAVTANLDEDGNTALFLVRPGHEVEAISDSEEGVLNYHSLPDINTRGDVAFGAYDTSTGQSGIYVYRHRRIDLLYANGNDPCINAHGTVAFTRFSTTPGESWVMRGNGGALTTIASSTGDFTHVICADINSSGQVAFVASLRKGAVGVCVGDGASTRRVVSTGDTVLGKQVAAVSMPSINDGGELALEVRFADNSAAVVRAMPGR